MSREERPDGSERPQPEMADSGVTNPGYVSDDVEDGHRNRIDAPQIVESLPVDDISDRKSRKSYQFRYKVFKTIFMVLGPCSMVRNRFILP